MRIKGLFTHFSNNTNVIIYDNEIAKQKGIISWRGRVIDLKNKGINSYEYCKVDEWYINKDGTLEIITK